MRGERRTCGERGRRSEHKQTRPQRQHAWREEDLRRDAISMHRKSKHSEAPSEQQRQHAKARGVPVHIHSRGPRLAAGSTATTGHPVALSRTQSHSGALRRTQAHSGALRRTRRHSAALSGIDLREAAAHRAELGLTNLCNILVGWHRAAHVDLWRRVILVQLHQLHAHGVVPAGVEEE